MFDVKAVPAVVIGSGISGLFTALKLASAGVQTLLLTKSGLAENNSRYAQGGIAAVLPQNPEDSLDLHVQDTLIAGAGLCREDVARSILADGYPAIEDLLHYGVPFDRNKNNELALTREAAHSIRRILHAGGDATGHSVEMTLIEKVKAEPLITVIEYCEVMELLSAGGTCYGCQAVILPERKQLMVLAQYTVLATGGVGRIYSHTTNPAIATGDGMVLAYQAGAQLGDMEFVQFHPTAFYADGGVKFLISEALRGEGGILRNARGEAFATRYHADGELAPRDIVTRAIFSELRADNVPHVYLDISHLPVETIETRFPNILSNCARFNVDIRRDRIPVTPAAHYMMGGVAVDLDGRSTVEGLYAVGETAHTGLHGANRLASNSLLECVVLARRVSAHIANHYRPEDDYVPAAPLDFNPRLYRFEEPAEIGELSQSLRDLMWRNVGILRCEEGLSEALETLERMEDEALSRTWSIQVPAGIEYLNQVRVARLITESALARKESLGAHCRTDCPESGEKDAKTLAAFGTGV